MSAGRPPFVVRGRHVLVGMIVFFALIITVDVSFAVLAYRSAPGQVAGKPYETGLAYNREIARRDAARKLGWRGVVDSTAAAGGRRFEVEIIDRQGRPVTGLTLKGQLVRPATEAGRHALAFAEAAPGRYAAVAPAGPGAWDLGFEAVGGSGGGFAGERRLIWQ